MGVDAEVFLQLQEGATEAQINELSYQLGCRFREILGQWKDADGKPDYRVIVKPEEYHDRPEGQYCLRLFCRYYGPGYERGPAVQIIGLLDFLYRHNLVDKVFYGGDCGDNFDEVTAAFLEHLRAHWAKYAREPYDTFFDKENDGPTCCDHRMIRCGWGGKWAKWYCPCCGGTAERGDDAEISFSYKD